MKARPRILFISTVVSAIMLCAGGVFYVKKWERDELRRLATEDHTLDEAARARRGLVEGMDYHRVRDLLGQPDSINGETTDGNWTYNKSGTIVGIRGGRVLWFTSPSPMTADRAAYLAERQKEFREKYGEREGAQLHSTGTPRK